MSPAEAKAEGYAQAAPATPEPPAYPWGTCLTLTDEAVKALFPGGPPAEKAEVMLEVTAYVKSFNRAEQRDGSFRTSIELQCTDIEMEEPDEDKPSAAETLYPAKA